MSTDLHHGFITGGIVTGANRADTKEIMPLVGKSHPYPDISWIEL